MLTIGTTLVLVAGLAVVWVRVVQTLTESSTGPKTVGQPGALVWDGRVFTSPAQLKSFLNAKGLSYSRWVARHPTAFGGSAPAATRHPTATRKHPTTTRKHPTATRKHPATKPKPATPHVAAPPLATGTKSRPLIATLLTILLLIGGAVLGGSAVLPRRYAPIGLQRFYASPDRRMVALATATAVLLAFGVSFYLT